MNLILVMSNFLIKYWMLNGCSYNPLERREVSKGGRETSKKSANSQASTKGSTAQRPQSSHNSRRNEVSNANPTNQAAKVARAAPSAGNPAPVYEEKVFFVSSHKNY